MQRKILVQRQFTADSTMDFSFWSGLATVNLYSESQNILHLLSWFLYLFNVIFYSHLWYTPAAITSKQLGTFASVLTWIQQIQKTMTKSVCKHAIHRGDSNTGVYVTIFNVFFAWV